VDAVAPQETSLIRERGQEINSVLMKTWEQL